MTTPPNHPCFETIHRLAEDAAAARIQREQQTEILREISAALRNGLRHDIGEQTIRIRRLERLAVGLVVGAGMLILQYVPQIWTRVTGWLLP